MYQWRKTCVKYALLQRSLAVKYSFIPSYLKQNMQRQRWQTYQQLFEGCLSRLGDSRPNRSHSPRSHHTTSLPECTVSSCRTEHDLQRWSMSMAAAVTQCLPCTTDEQCLREPNTDGYGSRVSRWHFNFPCVFLNYFICKQQQRFKSTKRIQTSGTSFASVS